MGFVRGEQRSQGALFPVSLDELIPEDRLVRVIDLWVDRVDVVRLGFSKAAPKGTGRPPNRAINHQAEGTLFQKSDFRYDAEQDSYRGPAGVQLQRKQVSNQDRIVIYITTACSSCARKPECTRAKQRFVSRHFDEAAFEAAQAPCLAHPEMMKRRQAIVEHPFGNLKERIFGNGRFLVRGL